MSAKELYFFTDVLARAASAAAALQCAGYAVPDGPMALTEFASGYAVIAHAGYSSHADLDRIDAEASRIAAETGVTFDGWGEYIGPLG